ncbi:MAG: hypothetical protein IT176_06995 [Acidobacteria bacterium]|nr:hypothetical protein [Acidobacteriota bacterium]
MTTRTRYFVFGSLLVLGVGVAAGLVAYSLGYSTIARSSAGGPPELQYVPRDAAIVAYADVQDVMGSDLRRRLKAALPSSENGQEEFQARTGINVETDIDRVVAVLARSSGSLEPHDGMVVASGRFDNTRIESLMREHGAQVEEYRNKRVLVSADAMHRRIEPDGRTPPAADRANRTFALAFLEPGIIAVGSSTLVRHAVDLDAGGDNITTNDQVMALVRALDNGNNAWALGHFEALRPEARLPDDIVRQLPAIDLFSVSAHIDGGVYGTLRAETRDDEAASNLRDVVRGLLALGRLQAGSNPEVQAMMQSLELGGSGRTVALSFSVPAELFDLMGDYARRRHSPGAPAR